jgi:NADPH-ferrihemoprotein reductase
MHCRTLDSIAWTEDTADSTPLPHLHLHETIKHNLLWSCELTHPPTKALLVALAEHTSDAREAHTLRFLASRDGRGAYQEDIIKGRPDLLQLLQRYPTCRPPISRLLELLGPLRPRQYSLANSAATAPELLECAFKVVEYTTHWGPHQGVATTWLEREVGRCGGPEGVYYPVSLRPTTGFRPPKDSTVPLIMVGPGTGVAPFRGFLQERRARAAKGAKLGESWLFFGNWREDWDFLFEEAFRGFAADGTLSHLCLAWSRTSEKVCSCRCFRSVGYGTAKGNLLMCAEICTW